MAVRQHEAVAVGPFRVRRAVAQMRFHSTSAISAMPMGVPGWPELAFCTASMDSARMALANSRRVGNTDPVPAFWAVDFTVMD